MNKLFKTFAIIIIGAIALYSCKSEKTATSTAKTEEVKKEEIKFECSSKITYTASVKPILESACVQCHSGDNPKHGIDLTTYENVKAATGHNLFCTISGGERCPKMPPFGGKLNAEEVSKIDCWIKNGMAQ